MSLGGNQRRLHGPEGEMNHQSDGKKAAFEKGIFCGKLMEDEIVVEMEVDADVRQAESAEIKSPKRKVIRAESEDTQSYVGEMLTIIPEKAEEVVFVSSALSEPRGATHFCDNRISQKAVRY